MCTVNIKVDEAVMQRINPSLTSNELIGKWLQEQVDMLIEEYESPDMIVEEPSESISRPCFNEEFVSHGDRSEVRMTTYPPDPLVIPV